MNNSRTYIWLLITMILVYISGLPVDVMEIDAAQYATISWEMFESGNYLQLYCNGQDYLDKPPFLFWINQCSFFLFGVHEWSYKIPNLFFLCLSLLSVYKLGSLLYDKKTGWMATAILGSSVAWVLMANDVRTDGILCAAVIYTLWQWKAFSLYKKWGHLLGIAAGISVGMLTKGPLGLIIPAAVMGFVLMIQKDWKVLFSWKYLLVLILVGIALSPMLYGLYQQYDLHPGKIVNGQKINSGIRFYLWTQSFGRITGESNWSNHSSPFYFLPVILWAFLPWSIFLVQSILHSLKNYSNKSLLPLAGFMIPLVALSLSRYKLPHYIFISFPFMALLVARYLSALQPGRFLKAGMYFLHIIIGVAIPFLGYCMEVPLFYIILSTLIPLIIYIICAVRSKNIWITGTWISIAGLYAFINLFFFPAMMKFQSPSQAGITYQAMEPDKNIPLVEIDTWGFSTEFYALQPVKFYNSVEELANLEPAGYYWIHISEKAYPTLAFYHLQPVYETYFNSYPISKLKPGFLWPATRPSYISKTRLVKVYLP